MSAAATSSAPTSARHVRRVATVAAVSTAAAPKTSQGAREAWLDAGQELLRDSGVAAVKLDALTRALGLTTGSFYHHFDGMKQYLDELARLYGSDQVKANLDLADVEDPRERIRQLGRIARRSRMRRLDAAMRDWAGNNPIAAESVRAADEQLLLFMSRAFRDLGYSNRDAQLRAQILLSFGVARVTPPWRIAVDNDDRMLAILAP
jgi:AcrR family transcriptional regulator